MKNFRNLLQPTNIEYDVIGITESGITKNISLTHNIELGNYSYEHTPTESSVGGTLLYVANHYLNKTRSDLNVSKKIELDSTFMEIINAK